MANRRIGGPNGGSDKASSGLAAVGVAVVALGALGAGTAGTMAGVTSSSVGESVDQSISVRKADSKKSARKGDSEAAWRRLGLRELKKRSKTDLECLTASFSQVQEFFARTPCASLDRMLFAVGDDQGNSAVVSVVWVGFRTTRDVTAFKTVMDRQGSGDIRPLATPLLDLADIQFTGLNYDSETNGKSIAIAETETATGSVPPDLLDTLAEVASQLPKP
jgi:hypothetical protein